MRAHSIVLLVIIAGLVIYILFQDKKPPVVYVPVNNDSVKAVIAIKDKSIDSLYAIDSMKQHAIEMMQFERYKLKEQIKNLHEKLDAFTLDDILRYNDSIRAVIHRNNL